MKPLNEKQATVKAIADSTHPLSDGSLPIRLRVTYQRERKYYTINDTEGNPMSIESIEGFDTLMTTNHRIKAMKDLKDHINNVESGARSLIENMSQFTFDGFRELFKGKKPRHPQCLFDALEACREALVREGRISTATGYKCTLQSLRAYTGKNKLSFKAITPEWLRKYEGWMKDQGNSTTTTGIYLRNVRTLFNDEIRAGRLDETQYPFRRSPKDNRFEIPTGSNVKKALTIEQVRIIAAHAPKNDTEAFYRDMWLFSYFGNGMNPKDICGLRHKDVTRDAITFLRAKTQRTKKQKLITVPMLPQLQAIVDKWANKENRPDNYLFPVLWEGATPQDIYKRVQQFVKSINHYLSGIAVVYGIDANITTYVARHSFATVLKRSGASIEYISESLGHKDLKTTENYLAGFELEKMKEINLNLI